ncbi:MAG: hypothetical protein WAM62_04070 [Pseudolabrys sp.]
MAALVLVLLPVLVAEQFTDPAAVTLQAAKAEFGLTEIVANTRAAAPEANTAERTKKSTRAINCIGNRAAKATFAGKCRRPPTMSEVQRRPRLLAGKKIELLPNAILGSR